MKRLTTGVALVAVSGLALAAMFLGQACETDQTVQKGPPVLAMLQVFNINGKPFPDKDKSPFLDLLAPPAGGISSISPRLRFAAVFDRILDPTKLVTIDPDGGFVGNAGVATVTWEMAPMGAMPITTATTYIAGGNLDTNPPGPQIAITVVPGLPAGSKITLALDKTKITGKANEPMSGTNSFTLDTEPLSATIGVPMAGTTVTGAFLVKVQLNNLPGPAAPAAISVTANGTPAMVAVAADKKDPTLLIVSPAAGPGVTCSGTKCAWDDGMTFKLTVAATASDIFGVTLAAAKTGTFMTEGIGPDGGADGSAD